MKLFYKHKEPIFLLLLLLITVFLRFGQLGYSHFYGDETKALYIRKDVAAHDFLLDQRKGPVQFIAAWFMEQVTGGYSELTTRLPFALAGTFSVFLFYFLVRRLYGLRAAVFASLLFSLNGFFIAFSRTVQYQSFLWLFGLASVLLLWLAFENTLPRFRKLFLLFAGLFLGLAFLSHWDAIFYALPMALILFAGMRDKVFNFKEVLFYFAPPLVFSLAAFYVPYFLNGHYAANFQSYVQRRATGSGQLPSNSLFTYLTYNPYGVGLFLLFYFAFALTKKPALKEAMLLIWFIVPFVVFELVFSNPGTHIQNYIIPLLILAGLGFSRLSKYFERKGKLVAALYYSFTATLMVAFFVFQSWAFIPVFNNGYPWNAPRVQKKEYQLFMYGFPYNRGWDQIRSYSAENSIRTFYTNDNITVGEYYLYGVPATPLVAPKQIPHAYIYVLNNQEGKTLNEEEILRYYELEQEFFIDGVLTAKLYRVK